MSQLGAELDKVKDKMHEYEVDHLDDNDSDVSAPSLDSEFNVPIMQTPGVKNILTSENEKLCRSPQAKNPVTWFVYNDYMAHCWDTSSIVVVSATQAENRIGA